MAEKSKITTATIQKLLSDPKNKIQLHNLVHKETEDSYKAIEEFSTQTREVEAVAKKAIPDFVGATANLRTVVSYGSYFGTQDQAYLWAGTLNRLGTQAHSEGSVFLIELQLYPALLVMYAGGIAALASENAASLNAILSASVKSRTKDPRPLALEANCTMLGNSANRLLDLERRKTPLSDRLNELFSESLPSELIFGHDFDQLFDDWEILLAMYVADHLRDRSMGAWGPVGRFAWREGYSSVSPLKALRAKLDKDNADWFPLKAGLFGGSRDRAQAALEVIEKIAGQVSFF